MKRTVCTLLAFFLATSVFAAADIAVEDDLGRIVNLAQPAQRVVSLSPHITEILFSAGAGDKIVGTATYSDYPEAAKQIPRVGSFNSFDFERIAALEPDLIIGWESGNPASGLQQLRKLGFTLYITEPRTIDDIASNIQRLATLTGTEAIAAERVQAFREGVAQLRLTYADAAPLTYFYEIWHDPLMTLNGEHLFSDIAKLCGGQNVFADLPALAPRVSVEAVLAKNPQVIIASGSDHKRPDWLDDWNKWGSLQAVKNNNLYAIPPDLVQRHTLRVLDGARLLCAHFDKARSGDAAPLQP